MLNEENINKLYSNINENIKYIENDINNNNVSEETIKIYNTLNEDRKTFYELKINTKEYLELKKEYGYKILKLKKELISYYNKELTKTQARLNNIINYLKYKNDLILLDTIKNLKLPESMSTISNFQKKVRIEDLESLIKTAKYINNIESKYSIKWDENWKFDLYYIENYELKNLVESINRYLDGERGISKQSLIIDIELCVEHVKNVEKKYSTYNELSMQCLDINNKLNELTNKIKTNNKNSEYQILKDKIAKFNKKLNEYYDNNLNISDESDKDIINLKNEYDNLKDEINNKYKDKNKQLYENLTKYLNSSFELLNKIENNNTNIEQDTEPKLFKIKKIEDAKAFYKKYNKPILYASGVASMALLNKAVGPIIIPTIIFANIVLSKEYSIIDKINDILAKSIGATKDKFGNFIKNNKITIGINDAYSGLLKSISLLNKKSVNVITDLVNRIKESRVVVETNEHINNLKSRLDTRKNEKLDLKTTKVYYEYILSGKSLEEFCKDKNLPDDIFNNLVEFIQYKEYNDNKGRSK